MILLLRDLRYSTRALARRPLFTIAAILSIAIGIGGATGIYSVFDAVVLRPLPFDQPRRLVQASLLKEDGRGGGPWSFEQFEAYRRSTGSFEALSARTYLPVTVTTPDRAEIIQSELVTANYFRALRVAPIRGRLFGDSEDDVAVISHRLQQLWFGNGAAVGRVVRINQRPFTILGVMPDVFRGLSPVLAVDLWLPLSAQGPLAFGTETEARRTHWLGVFGRLRDGASLDQARAEGIVAGRRLSQAGDREGEDLRVSIDRFRGIGIPPARRASLGSWSAVLGILIVLILVLACSNVANLLLVRASERSSELGIRLALGSSRGRLVRRLLTESVEVTVIGGMVGFVLAWLTNGLFRHLSARLPAHLHSTLELTPDLRIFALTFGMSVAAGALFGLIPALRAVRVDVTEAVREGAAPATAGARASRVQSTLVAVQVGMSFLLLLTAGLELRSLQVRTSVDPGMNFDKVVSLSLDLDGQKLSQDGERHLVEELSRRLAAIPGVLQVAAVGHLPFVGRTRHVEVRATDQKASDRTTGEPVAMVTSSPGTLRLLGIRLLQGRDLEASDAVGAPPVALVNRELARRTGGEGGALGRTIRVGKGSDQREVQVVGVIEDVMYDTIRSEPTPMLLRPVEQVWSSQVGFLLRGAAASESLMPSVRDVVRSVDPDLPVLDLVPTQVQYDNVIHRNRSLALLFAAVAVGGLLLATCGVFGVVSYVVRRRHRELAVRRVLGADALRVIALVLRGTMTAVVAGLVVGLGAGLLLARVLSRFLFGIPPSDPLTFAGVSVFLLLVSSLAALLPTRQAVRLDPASSLRQD